MTISKREQYLGIGVWEVSNDKLFFKIAVQRGNTVPLFLKGVEEASICYSLFISRDVLSSMSIYT